MSNYYYLAIQEPTPFTTELTIRVDPKGFFGFTYYFRTQKFYASKLSYIEARFLKFISPLFTFKNDSGEPVSQKESGKVVIRKY